MAFSTPLSGGAAHVEIQHLKSIDNFGSDSLG